MEMSRPDGEIPENAFDKPALPCNGNSASIIEGKLLFPKSQSTNIGSLQ